MLRLTVVTVVLQTQWGMKCSFVGLVCTHNGQVKLIILDNTPCHPSQRCLIESSRFTFHHASALQSCCTLKISTIMPACGAIIFLDSKMLLYEKEKKMKVHNLHK